MPSSRHRCLAALAGAALLACGGGGLAPDPTDAACSAAAPVALAVGAWTVLEASRLPAGCLRLAATDAGEYLVAIVNGAGIVTPSGFRVTAEFGTGRSVGQRVARVGHRQAAEPAAARLHAALRRREATLSRPAPSMARRQEPGFAARPAVGDQRTFRVCADLDCATTAPVTARARLVGRRIAIFVDVAAPPGGFTDAELAETGALFDDQLYPIDTLAFGAESDIDGNGVVIALLTPAVNRLSPACTGARGLVLGYFFGADLTPGEPGSNAGEVFFAAVPDPASPTCPVARGLLLEQLPVTFVHEFQHMISWNQHVLLRNGPPEATWLNEGLSHLAEELAGRLVPDPPGDPRGSLTRFAFNNVDNAYEYLLDPASHFVVIPGLSAGSAAERGAVWLLTRWLVDRFDADSSAGERLTRRLVGTGLVGAANVEAATGAGLPRLLAEWQLANAATEALDTAATPLDYRSWRLRTTYASLHRQDPGRFPRPYPLVPPPLAPQERRTLVLPGGSGTHAIVRIEPAPAPVALRLTAPPDASGDLRPLADGAQVRLAILRLR